MRVSVGKFGNSIAEHTVHVPDPPGCLSGHSLGSAIGRPTNAQFSYPVRLRVTVGAMQTSI